jgi:hypothetical protein
MLLTTEASHPFPSVCLISMDGIETKYVIMLTIKQIPIKHAIVNIAIIL